ncbi:hypothetical protein A4H97_32205 [Niastella yeongjuensis]|uniref:Uncharacterized protein n=1 Tax=Niastella yeongjuensis TaxID=354355 RepID=A0A1V9EIE5_9BACT|nr:hypothetical protein [Niastella yeongjuensis]OQP45906.1 hypothetical protein A4H97_32205 [Niastella yeongjuensis]SEP46859.1 hypothetical protein SAMN05660816_06523 [Niastella yeongjuensis]
MKRLVLILFTFISIYASGQQLTTEIRARQGVFTERLYLKDRWIDRISTNLNGPDSASDNLLATAKAIADFAKLKAGNPIQNQFNAPQPASFWLHGTGTIGALSGYRKTLAGGFGAQMNITQNEGQHGLSIQQANYNAGYAGFDLFKNAGGSFNTLQGLQPGDSIGSFIFSGVAGDNSTIANAMSLHGLVETTAPAYLSSGFVFNTTDSNGILGQRMWLNGQGNLMLGNETTNPYSLNVADGDVRINSLAGGGDGLVLSDENGALYKLLLGENLYVDVLGMLNVSYESINPSYRRYMAILSQHGTGRPDGFAMRNGFDGMEWARVATGVYTATLAGAFASGYTFLKSEASDETGHAAYVKLYRSGPDTVTMVVKDESRNNTDDWSRISVEIREYYPN